MTHCQGRMVNSILLFWALVGLIGRVHGKCSLAPIVDNERSIAYACIHGDLSDLNELPADTEWIEFSVSRFHAIHDDAFRRFPNLRRLSFYNCHVNVIEPAAFRGLHRLDWLIFRGTRIHVVRAAWFRHLPNLRKLILDRCGLVHIEPDVFRTLPRLETLDLRDNDLDCLSVEELSHLTMLRTVRIDGNPWLCECRRIMENFFHERSIVQVLECRARKKICVVRNLQCMTQIDVPLQPPTITIEQIGSRVERPSGHFQTSVLTSLDRLPDKTTWIEISGLWVERLPAYAFFRFGKTRARQWRMRESRDSRCSYTFARAFFCFFFPAVISRCNSARTANEGYATDAQKIDNNARNRDLVSTALASHEMSIPVRTRSSAMDHVITEFRPIGSLSDRRNSRAVRDRLHG